MCDVASPRAVGCWMTAATADRADPAPRSASTSPKAAKSLGMARDRDEERPRMAAHIPESRGFARSGEVRVTNRRYFFNRSSEATAADCQAWRAERTRSPALAAPAEARPR